MIRLREVTLARGATRLLDRASLTVHVGQKVGVIGSNGCGKSTLFALLRGEIAAEGGDVEMPAKWRIAHVAQETPAVETPAIDYVLDGDEELRAVEAELAAAEAAHDADGHHVAELHQRFDAIGGYASRARAAELLAGLGVLDARHNDPVARFSGGWRMRLNLAKALMARSDLLLLDEPTNHLDLDAVLWLEEWLKRYPGTLLLITHDRDFLDGVAQAIVHFDAQKLKAYGGNYTVFERERAMQLAMQRAAYDKQQRQIVHLKSFVDRFRAKATKAKQAQSRLRTLERMELIAAAHVDSPFEFAFARSTAVARELTRLENATLRYADAAPVFEGLDLAIANGERIGILGPNGAGKSTLVKALAGELPLAAGRRSAAPNLRIGYFAQHQLEQLDSTLSPLAQMQRVDPQARERRQRAVELFELVLCEVADAQVRRGGAATRCERQLARQRLDQRRLARAVGTEEPDALAIGNRQVEALEYRRCAGVAQRRVLETRQFARNGGGRREREFERAVDVRCGNQLHPL